MGVLYFKKDDRDTLGFAMKCSAICVDGVWRDVYKQPKTDSGKNSKRGKLKLVISSKEKTLFSTVRVDIDKKLVEEVNTLEFIELKDLLETIFLNGKLVKEENWETIRERCK